MSLLLLMSLPFQSSLLRTLLWMVSPVSVVIPAIAGTVADLIPFVAGTFAVASIPSVVFVVLLASRREFLLFILVSLMFLSSLLLLSI